MFAPKEYCKDHVHMLVRIPPSQSVSSFMARKQKPTPSH
ncbi:transposase [Aequitasia blattaphilus]